MKIHLSPRLSTIWHHHFPSLHKMTSQPPETSSSSPQAMMHFWSVTPCSPIPPVYLFPSFFLSFCKAATLAKEERDSKYCVWTSYFLSLVSTKFCQSRVQYEGARLWNRFIQWNKFDFFVFYIRIMFIRWNTYFS